MSQYYKSGWKISSSPSPQFGKWLSFNWRAQESKWPDFNDLAMLCLGNDKVNHQLGMIADETEDIFAKTPGVVD